MFRTECIYWTEKETITPTSIPVEMTTYKPVSEPTFTYQFFTTNRITGCMKCPFYVTQYDEANHYVHNTCKGVCPTKSFAVPGMFYNHQTEDKLAEWFKECKLFAVQEIK
jgi:ferredoxin